MRTSSAMALTLASLTLGLPACTGKGKTASVSGDVFLLMQNGDVKRGAGNTVLLLGPADSVLAVRGRICAAYGRQLVAAAREGNSTSEEALKSRMMTQLLASFVPWTVGSSKTGINAHYRIEQVPAGQYILSAETRS